MNHEDGPSPDPWSCETCPWWERYKRDAEGFEVMARLNPDSNGVLMRKGQCVGSTPPFDWTWGGQRCAVHPDAPKPDLGYLRQLDEVLAGRETEGVWTVWARRDGHEIAENGLCLAPITLGPGYGSTCGGRPEPNGEVDGELLCRRCEDRGEKWFIFTSQGWSHERRETEEAAQMRRAVCTHENNQPYGGIGSSWCPDCGVSWAQPGDPAEPPPLPFIRVNKSSFSNENSDRE